MLTIVLWIILHNLQVLSHLIHLHKHHYYSNISDKKTEALTGQAVLQGHTDHRIEPGFCSLAPESILLSIIVHWLTAGKKKRT